MIIEEITISKENGEIVIRNSDIKEAKKMMTKVMIDITEGIYRLNQLAEIIEIKEYVIRMRSIRKEMSDALMERAYEKDTSILPKLTIRGDKILNEIGNKILKIEIDEESNSEKNYGIGLTT